MKMEEVKKKVYRNMATEKGTALKLLRILFFGCFFASVVGANTVCKNEAAWMGYMFQSAVMDLSVPVASEREMMLTVLYFRIPVWLFFLCFGRMFFGKLMTEVAGAVAGAVTGFVFSAFLIRFGIFGIILFGLLIFPQYPCYLISFLILFQNNLKDGSLTGKRKAVILANITFFAGVLLESYVNVIFLIKAVDFLKNF